VVPCPRYLFAAGGISYAKDMDPETLRAAAKLARMRAERGGGSAAREDGMARLGAARALNQLAADLDVTADEFDRPAKKRSRHNPS
jgi:hypothetical protein